MCMVDGADDNYTVYNTPRLVCSRKDHKCDECYRVIAKGEQYYRGSGLYDGRWDVLTICVHCNVAGEWLAKNCGGFLHHGIREDIEEHTSEYNHTDAFAGLARLTVGMRRKWLVKRGTRSGQLMPLPKLPAPIKQADFL
jgi:hypothetical protein